MIELFTFNIDSKALVILMILSLSLYLQFIYKPFSSEKMNDFEQQGIFINLMIVFLGLNNHVSDSEEFKTFFTAFAIGLYIFFYIYWIYKIWIQEFVIEKIFRIESKESSLSLVKKKIKIFFYFLFRWKAFVKQERYSPLQRIEMKNDSGIEI